MTKAAKCLSNFDQMVLSNSMDRSKTVEEKEQESLQLFQTDACVTVVSALSAMVSELATKVCDMVELSAKSEKREKYQILRDYTTNPDVLSASASIRKAVSRQNSAINELIRLLTRNSTMFRMTDSHSDAGIDFISRVDASDEEFAKDYTAIRKKLTDMLRPFKCSDPVMLYALVNLMYMARRFDSVARYVSDFAVGFRQREPFNPMLHLKVLRPLELMANRMKLTDKSGHTFVFLYTLDDMREWQKTIAKRSWQKANADNPPVVVNLHELFAHDDIVRISWQLETHMFELKTIDKLIAASEGHDPEYRHDYRFKRIQSCASTYEQAMLNQTIYCNRWSELPSRMRQYVDSVNRRHFIDPRRRPKPVVCFKLQAVYDKRGNLLRDPKGEPQYKPVFAGIWNSAYEADIETDVSWKKIRRSVELKAVNDGTNHIWLSLEDYISMTYSSLSKVREEVAEEFKRLLPEFKMRTTRQIAADTNVPQGSFSEAAIHTAN